MLRIIKGLPPDTLGIAASGTVTFREFQDILLPAAQGMMADSHLLFIARPDFDGFAAKGAWSGIELSPKLRHTFARIALVTGLPWLRAAAGVSRMLLSGELALFEPMDLPSALQWLADGHAPHPNRSFLETEILRPSFKDIGQIVDAEDIRRDTDAIG